MAIENLDLIPMSNGPYPRVPNVSGPEVPHQYYQCDDPDWCLHGELGEEADLAYRLEPLPSVPFATEPKIFGDTEYSQVNSGMPGFLQSLGFTERESKGLAIRFYGEEDAEGKHFKGYFSGGDFMSSSEVPEYYPLVIHVRKELLLEETNQVILHELGHAYIRMQGGESSTAYSDEHTLKTARRAGGAAALLGAGLEVGSLSFDLPTAAHAAIGVGSGLLALGGIVTYAAPRRILWHLNKEERACNRFARKHKTIQPLLG